MRRVPLFYTDHDTFLHRLDPRAKVLWLLFVVLFLFSAPPMSWMVAFAVVGVVTAAVARVPAKWLAVVLLIQVPNIIGFIVIPLVAGVLAGDVSLTSDVRFGVRLGAAWLGAVAVFAGLFSTMRIDQFTDGMRGVGAPKVVANAFGYAFRLLYNSIDDLLRIVDGLRIRGLDLDTRNPLALVRRVPTVLVPAVATVARRSSAMMSTLRLRGFTVAGGNRPVIALGRIGVAEVVFVAAGLLAVLAGIEQRFDLTPLTLP